MTEEKVERGVEVRTDAEAKEDVWKSQRGPGSVRYLETIAEMSYRLMNGAPAPRPTTYKGVQFRSRLEARFACHLDAQGIPWAYEPRTFGENVEGYLPDFELTGYPQPTFVEVKPTRAEIREAARRMRVIWDVHPDALLIVSAEEGCTWSCAVARGVWETWVERWSA